MAGIQDARGQEVLEPQGDKGEYVGNARALQECLGCRLLSGRLKYRVSSAVLFYERG